MTLTPPPPVGGAEGHWPHHEWIAQAIRQLDIDHPKDGQEGLVALNGDWWATHPPTYDEPLRVHRVGPLAVISGVIQQMAAGTFPSGGVMGAVPAGFLPATHQILSTVGASNVSIRWDIQSNGSIVLNHSAGILQTQYCAFACPYILAEV